MGICPPPARRGTILTLAIVLSVVITGLVITMSWVAGSQASATASFSKLDQAFFAAEAGAQRAAWYAKNGTLSQFTSITGSVNGYAYSVTWTNISANTFRITSVGSLGSVSYTYAITAAAPIIKPAVFTVAGDVDGKNIVITGSVITGGNFTDGGSGSVSGDLVYYGSASNTDAVNGAVVHATGDFAGSGYDGINFSTLGATLIASAGASYSGDQDNKHFDFTTLPGTNKVIYVDGSVKNPHFKGTGTLYVSGTVTTDNFGTEANPVNIVAAKDVTTSDNITMYGSIYTGGNWSRGKFNMTGIIFAEGTVIRSNTGKSYLTLSSVPWFDPRTPTGGGTSSVIFSNCSGPGI